MPELPVDPSMKPLEDGKNSYSRAIGRNHSKTQAPATIGRWPR